MKGEMRLDPYCLPESFRSYVYEFVVLAWEVKKVEINPEKFSKKDLAEICGLYVLKIDKLIEMDRRDQEVWPTNEFLYFYGGDKVKGYECLFRRLRDAFAHGHYGSCNRGWVEIRHFYKNRGQEKAVPRVFGRVRINTLKI
ncbi:hypothetical protein [Malikia spinosa]|uniref:hypothetical protein n=1 Tax=Malikia spinosa TaxID=86180 RepID=UPI0011B0BCDD|nr:hypothetical protein [Malikia spinosa]